MTVINYMSIFASNAGSTNVLLAIAASLLFSVSLTYADTRAADTKKADTSTAKTITTDPNKSQPNIVLLLADDLGFSDIGSFGSEIATPHLDALAQRGIRFTNYHTASSCAPTRAMLMSGLSSHKAGLGNMPESLAPEMGSSRAYAGYLEEHTTVAEQLSAAGYRTYMTGKWHLGATPETLLIQG